MATISLDGRADRLALLVVRDIADGEYIVFGPLGGTKKTWSLCYGVVAKDEGRRYHIHAHCLEGFAPHDARAVWQGVIERLSWLRPGVEVHFVRDNLEGLCEKLWPIMDEDISSWWKPPAAPEGPPLTSLYVCDVAPTPLR